MKRSEPQWKRQAAREHCKARRDAIWNALVDEPPIVSEWFVDNDVVSMYMHDMVSTEFIKQFMQDWSTDETK